MSTSIRLFGKPKSQLNEEERKIYERTIKQEKRNKCRAEGIDPIYIQKRKNLIKNILEGKDINLTLIDTYNISYDEIKDNLDNIHLKVKLCFLSKEEQINKPFKLNIYKPSIQEFYDVINNMNLTDTSKKGYKSKIKIIIDKIDV